MARALVASVVLVDLFAFGLVARAEWQSRARYRERAVVGTQNLAGVLEHSLAGLIDEIDLGIRAVADEHAREVVSGGMDGPALEAVVARQRARLPMVHAIRTVDADGMLVHGLEGAPQASVADRAYFARLRVERDAGLVISEPVIGKLSGRPELVLSRRLEAADGSFAGAVIALVAVEDVERSFSGLDVGRRGVVVLRDANLALVVRHQTEGLRPAFGDRTTSPELAALVRAGATHGTYRGVAVDGIERTFTFRKVGRFPLYVIVGLAFDDYLGEWRREALLAALPVAIFAVVTALAAWFAHRSWVRRVAAVEALAAQEARFRARLSATERMASLGTLAAGVAHEINNPLTYVLGNVAFALEQLREAQRGAAEPERVLRDVGQALREALAGAERVRHIVGDLRTFSRPQQEALGPVDPNAVVEVALHMTASQTAARARVVRQLGDVPPVLASEARLGQVLVNLLVNAAQAIPPGRPDANQIVVTTARAPDGRAAVEVRDSGAGIAPEVLPRIFDPFFTTKDVGEGTGLGLSICHGIVQALGGEIQVESTPARGTRFRVLLPAAPAALLPEAEPAPRAS